MNEFEALTDKNLAAALEKQGITTPTSIQRESVPLLLRGDCAFCSCETGSGKTLAYLLPVFMDIDKNEKKPQSFIIAPTRELAAQIQKQAELLCKNLGDDDVKPTLVIGGASVARQIDKLKDKPRIIIGTAARILELVKMKKLSAHCVRTIVLDEADKLLDKKNIADTTALIKSAQADTRVSAFSAAYDAKTERAFKTVLGERPVTVCRVATGTKKNALPENIEHYVVFAERRDKIKVLRKLAHTSGADFKAIVFVNNAHDIKALTERLNFHGVSTVGFFGGKSSEDRKYALDAFRDGRAQTLVSSDVSARGLDVPNVTHVINYDAPASETDYLHRAGRTGRAGKSGAVVSIFSAFETRSVTLFEKAFNIKITEKSFKNI